MGLANERLCGCYKAVVSSDETGGRYIYFSVPEDLADLFHPSLLSLLEPPEDRGIEKEKKKNEYKEWNKLCVTIPVVSRNEGPWKLTGAPWMDSPFGPWGPGGPCGPKGPISPGGPWGPLNIKLGHYLNKHNLSIKSSWFHSQVYFPQYNYVTFQAYHQPGCWNKVWMPCSLLLHQGCNNQGSKRHSSQSSLWQTS